MIKTITTTCLILLLGIIMSLNAQTYISYEEAKSDALQLQQKLLLVHPAVETVEDKYRVEQQIKRLIKLLPDQIEVTDFYNQLAIIIDSIPCGHTSMRPPKLEKVLNGISFPIPFEYIEGKVVTKGENHIKEPTAFELLSIDNVNIDTILNKLVKYQNITDEELLYSKKKNAVARFNNNYNLFYPSQPSYNYLIKDVNSDLRIRSTADKSQKSKVQKQIPITYEYDKDQRIGKLDLNSFMGYDPYQLRYKLKIKNIFKQIEEQGVEKLIIDVRRNGGGAASNMNCILKYLLVNDFKSSKELKGKKAFIKDLFFTQQLSFIFEKKDKNYIYLNRYCKLKSPKKKHRFDGKLVVLVDEGTFSAASLFSSLIKFNERGKLIGTIGGGSFDHTFGGFFKLIKLKNSRIQLTYPLCKVILDVDHQAQDKGTNLRPHIYIEQTIDDYIVGKDTVLEKAYEVLK